MENAVVKIMSENGLVSVNVDDVPKIIVDNIETISELERKVRSAEKSANEAMDFFGKQMAHYEERGVWFFKYRTGNTKDIVEDTQKALEKSLQAQQVNNEALTMVLDFQKKLAKTTKYLFDLGCANITMNRITVKAIEKKLSGASKEEISELAKQELISVVRQLKAQEDIHKKQEFLTSKVKDSLSRLKEKDNLDKEQSENIESLINESSIHEKRILKLHENLSEKDIIDEEQTQRLENLDRLLSSKEIVDKQQEESITKNKLSINKNTEAIKILVEYMQQKDLLDKEQTEKIKFLKIAVIILIVFVICEVAILLFQFLP